MRLSLFKFYRAYPELDKFTDEECQRLVWLARCRRDDAIWILPLGAAVLAAAVWLSIAGTVVAVGAAVLPWIAGTIISLEWWVSSAVGVAAAVAAWNWVRRQLIIRSIRNNMDRAKCPYCWFSLIGLPVKEGMVRCPECGENLILHDLRLLPEDLEPLGRERPNPPAVSPLRRDVGGQKPRMNADGRGSERSDMRR